MTLLGFLKAFCRALIAPPEKGEGWSAPARQNGRACGAEEGGEWEPDYQEWHDRRQGSDWSHASWNIDGSPMMGSTGYDAEGKPYGFTKDDLS